MMERRGIGKKLAGMAAAVMLMVLMMGMTSLAAAKTEGLDSDRPSQTWTRMRVLYITTNFR